MDFTLLLAPFEQLMHAPACAIIIVPISVVLYVIETMPRISSALVMPVSLLLGMVLFPCLTPISTVPATFPNPLIVLLLNGFILGFAAWIVHKLLIKKLIEKFGPKVEEPAPKKLEIVNLPAEVVKPTLPPEEPKP